MEEANGRVNDLTARLARRCSHVWNFCISKADWGLARRVCGQPSFVVNQAELTKACRVRLEQFESW